MARAPPALARGSPARYWALLGPRRRSISQGRRREGDSTDART